MNARSGHAFIDARLIGAKCAAAELGHRFFGAGVDRFLVGDVHRHGDRLAAFGDDRLGDLARILQIQVGNDDGRAVLCQLARALFANTTGGAGNECDFSLQ